MSVCWHPSPTPKGWSRGESSEGYMVSIVQGLGFRVLGCISLHLYIYFLVICALLHTWNCTTLGYKPVLCVIFLCWNLY